MTKSRSTRARRQSRNGIGDDCRALARHNRERAHAALSDEQKVERLGHSIVAAVVERGHVDIADCVRAGFGEAEAKRLFEQGIAAARVIEPRLDTMIRAAA